MHLNRNMDKQTCGCASAQSDQSICCPLEENMDPHFVGLFMPWHICQELLLEVLETIHEYVHVFPFVMRATSGY